MRIHEHVLKVGITRTKEFERKGLATHAVNVGIKCGNGCQYCSTGAVLRCHRAFKTCGENPFKFGYAIVDPTTPERIARDARSLRNRGKIQLCTLTDAWAPEARAYQLGRHCLEAILSESDWTVRILTKNAEIENDFDLISQYRDRIQVGLSITALPEKSDVMKVVEPNASSNIDRMAVLRKARKLGLRTYLMACPILPGILDTSEALSQLMEFAVEIEAEEIFAEPVNVRGSGLKNCQETLENNGFSTHATNIEKIRNRTYWSKYVADLIGSVQTSIRHHFDITKLRFLLYPGNLTEIDRKQIEQDDAGVIWL